MKSILELRDNATSTKRLYITADTSESLISTVNTVPLKLRATSGVTEQVVLNTNGTINFTGAATFSSSVTATSAAFNTSVIIGNVTSLTGSWGNLTSVLQLGNTTTDKAYISVNEISGDDDINIVRYAYFDNTNWKRIGGGNPSRYYQRNAEHCFQYASSGADNTTITWNNTLYISNGGNVGIGTTSPGVKLRVDSADADYATIIKNSNASGYGVQILTQGSGTNLAFQVRTNNTATNAFQVLDNGNVGIGETNPGVKLHVVASGAAVATFASSAANGGWIRFARNTSSIYGYAGSGYELVTGGANTDMALSSELGNLLFATNQGAERMRITSGGNVLAYQNYIVSRNGSDTIGAGAFLSLQTASGTNYQQNIQLGASGSLDFWNYDSSSWNMRMRITSSGNLLFNGTSNPGGIGNIYIGNSGSLPGTPSGGGVLYVEGGALKFKGSSGTITTIANA